MLHLSPHDRVRGHASEAGFTLPELLISMVITTIIIGSLASALIISLRFVGSTSTQYDEAHDTQIAANYFTTDAAATTLAGVSATSSITCADSPHDPSLSGVISFSWSGYDKTGSGSTFNDTADWVTKGTTLLRRFCINGVLQTNLTMSHNIAPGVAPKATITTAIGTTSTTVHLLISEPPNNPRISTTPFTYTLSGQLRPGGSAPNILTPPNLLLLDTTTSGSPLQVYGGQIPVPPYYAGGLNIYSTQSGSTTRSLGYVNSTSPQALLSDNSGNFNAKIQTRGGCQLTGGGSCATTPPGSLTGLTLNNGLPIPDPLKSLVSPANNAPWLATQALTTFTYPARAGTSSIGCGYDPNQTLDHLGVPRTIGNYCHPTGPGIYSGVTLWLDTTKQLLAGAYIVKAAPAGTLGGVLIGACDIGEGYPPCGSDHVQITSQSGVLLDLEAGSIAGFLSPWTTEGFGGPPSDATIDVTLNAAVGGPYSGISVFQPGCPTAPCWGVPGLVDNNVTTMVAWWDGTLAINGLVYAPTATVEVQYVESSYTTGAYLNSLIANDLYDNSFSSLQIGGLNLPGPQITSVSPNYRGLGAARQLITVSGSNFEQGALVQFGGSGITVNGNPTVIGTTTLTADVTVTAGATVGLNSVTVRNPDLTTYTIPNINFPGGFTVEPIPVITSVSPPALAQGSSNQTLTISGSGFLSAAAPGLVPAPNPGATATFPPVGVSGIVTGPATVLSATTISLPVISVAANAPATTTLTVDNQDGGTTATSPFTINPAPSISSISPQAMGQGAVARTLTINGANFQNGVVVTFRTGSGVTAGATTFVSAARVTAPVTVAANASVGTNTVTVTNPDTGVGTLVNGFTVDKGPTITGISPNVVVPGSGPHNVTITGTNFVAGATVALSGTGTAVNSVSFTSSTSLTASVTVATANNGAPFDVIVTNPDFGTATLAGVLNIPPTVPMPGIAAAVTYGSNPTFVNNETVTLTDAATDPGGPGVKSVSYYYCGYPGSCTTSTGTLIGSSITSPNYTVAWTSLPAAGPYQIVAVATDNAGLISGASPPALVTVDTALPYDPPPFVNGLSS